MSRYEKLNFNEKKVQQYKYFFVQKYKQIIVVHK